MRNLIPHFIHEQYKAGLRKGTLETSALIVDLTGFTAMTDSLMKFGKHGAEALSASLNQAFSPLVSMVYQNGGFITTFAGDAFTALFPEGFGYAAQTALSMCNFFKEDSRHTTPFGSFDLNVTVGLGMGTVTWALIGEGDRMVYYFKGNAIDDAVAAESTADNGQVVISSNIPESELVELVIKKADEKILLMDKQRDWMTDATPTPTFDREDLNPFILEAVIDLPASAEFRDVASVFIAFEPPETDEQLQSFVNIVLNSTLEFGGYFNKLDFGDKGPVMLSLFGAPIAHENDLERATQFLSHLRQSTQNINWRAALRYGLVYAGFLGGQEREEYTVIGDLVNVASRMSNVAGWGDILTVPETAVSLWAKGYQLESVGKVQFKGKTRPIAISRLVGQMQDVDTLVMFRGNLIGRDAEREKLALWTQPIFESKFGGIVYLYGEAGMGKSHLLHVFQEELQETAQFKWFQCRTDSILQQSLSPFRAFLADYFNQSPQNTPEENKMAFDEVMQTLLNSLNDTPKLQLQLKRTESFLGALIGLYWEGSLYEKIEESLRLDNTITAFLNLIQAEATLQPVILQVEDAHWIDDASLDLLHSMLCSAPNPYIESSLPYPVIILLTSRYTDAGEKFSFDLPPEVPSHEIELAPLNNESVHTLAQQILGGTITDTLVDFLISKTNGNPFFTEQLLLDLRDRKLISKDENKAWHVQTQETLAVPSSVSAVLVARLDRLMPEIKHLVLTGAVLGQKFDANLLLKFYHTVTDEAENNIQKKIEASTAVGIWGPLDKYSYIFRHALLCLAAYGMQLKDHLKELHATAAQVIEGLYPHDLRPHYRDLLYHFERAENEAKVRHYANELGQQELVVGNHREAENLFQQSLTLTEIPGARINLLKLLGDAQFRIGKYDEAEQNYMASQSLAEEHKNAEGLADARLGLGTIAYTRQDYDSAIETLLSSMALANELHNEGLVGQVLFWLGQVATEQGQYKLAQQHFEDSRRIAEQIGNRKGVADALATLGANYLQQDAYATAKIHLDKSLSIAREIGDRVRLAGIYHDLGIIGQRTGELSDARQNFEAAVRLTRELGDKKNMALSLSYLGDVSSRLGQDEAALSYYMRAYNIFAQIENKAGQAEIACHLGKLALYQSQYADAKKYLDEGITLFRDLGEPKALSEALTYNGYLSLSTEHVEKAENDLAEALPIAQAIGDAKVLQYCMVGFAWLYRVRGKDNQHLLGAIRAQDLDADLQRAINLANLADASPDESQDLSTIAAAIIKDYPSTTQTPIQ